MSVLVVGGLGSTFVVVVGLILGSMILSPVTDCTGSIHQHQREEALRGKILYFDPMHQVVTIPPGADPTTMPGYVRLSVADEQQFWRDHSGAITLAVWTSIWAYLQWPVYLLGLLVLAWLFRVSVFELIWDAFTDD